MIRTHIDGQEVVVTKELVEKYNQAGPRYTSYPTAPNWNDHFGPNEFLGRLKETNKKEKSLSLYFHLPFCEERCTFCACSVVATKQHSVVEPYLKALFKEIENVGEVLDRAPPLEQLHWGGGTPTYLSADQIEQLYENIGKYFSIADSAEVSIEIDPRVTTDDQLKTLRRLGFNRASLGVQDFESEVQKLAGRIQSEEETRHAIVTCRSLGFESVNVDLVYGLPKQTQKTFEKTLQKILELNPDRIALFNFAYVPWMHTHQKKIFEQDLPDAWTKLTMFCEAIRIFEDAGYEFIGLDHFAKKNDELSKARKEGTMYRNFQGYTTKANCDLIGLGVTSISFVSGAFSQNAKKLKDYEKGVSKNGFVTERGLVLSEDDLIRQKIIREIFCHQRVKDDFDNYFKNEKERLRLLEKDGLVDLGADQLRVTPLGRLFLRNIGMIFDAYLKPNQDRFSKTV